MHTDTALFYAAFILQVAVTIASTGTAPCSEASECPAVNQVAAAAALVQRDHNRWRAHHPEIQQSSCEGRQKHSCGANSICAWNQNLSRCQARIAWFHIMKCGSSFGATLAHFANSSLPRLAHMPSCTGNVADADEDRCEGNLTQGPRALQSSEDRVSTLQKQLAGRMMTDRNAIQQASGLAQIAAGRQEKLRVVLWISNRVTQEAAYSQARLCLWAWGRHALLQRHLEAAKPSKKEASPASPGSGTKGTKEVAAPSPAPSQVTDSGLALIHEAHLERCQSLAKWSAKRQSWLLAEQSAYRCLAAWRKFCFAAARQRLAEWSAEQLERQVNHGLLVYCFFSFRRFVKGTRRPGTAVKDEEGATEVHREELSLLTPAALCRATFHESASRRLRLVTVWQAWRSATVDLRQERVAVALHSRFEQEHDLMDERIIFCRDAVVKEKLRGHQAFLLRWIFDAFMRSTVMGRHKARSLRKEQELQSMFDDAKRSMVQLSSAAVAILERMRRDPKPWTMKLILHLWVFSTELSKEQLQTEGVQRHLKDALAEVSLLHRRLAAAGQPAREEPNPALEEFEAAGRAALSIYGSAETTAVKNRPASSSSSAYVSTEGPRVRVPKGNDFASTMAYLREARKNPGVAVWDQHVAPSPVENAGKSIGTNSALWAQLDELDGYMAGMSGRFEGT